MFVDCPADELGPCYFYEYSRESESLRRACASSRPAVPSDAANGFDYYVSSTWALTQNEIMSDPARVFMLWPEWPDKPYLQIPITERQRRLTWSVGGEGKAPATKKISFLAVGRANPEGLRPVSPVGATVPSGEAWAKGLTFSQDKLGWPAWEINPAMWEAVFWIDWRAFSDAQLVEMFKMWLDEYRPSPPAPPAQNPSVTNRFETHLKQLGALRVLRKFNENEIPPGIALYREKSEWARAKLVAQGVIEWFSV
jgi:hypothetical protein